MADLTQFMPDPLTAVYLVLGLVVVWWIVRRVDRFRRSRRPAVIHPQLMKYAQHSPELVARRRELASQIIATSSTDRVAGYEIVRQIEAVFEDGHRSPGEAVEAVKAAAAERGANAVINLSQERTAAGRCTANGDAVVVRAVLPPPPTPRQAGLENRE